MADPEGPSSALDDHFPEQHRPRSHRKPRRRVVTGCLPVLLVLAVLGGLGYGGYVGVTSGLDFLEDRFGAPADHAGPGQGEVLFEVVSGQSIRQIGQGLEEEDVVASTEAFTEAAAAEPLALRIQVGFYELKREMPAQDALEVLIDPEQIVTDTVTVPEGLPLRDIVERLGKDTDYQARQFERVLAAPQGLGLPSYAKGNAEGYLFPATYAFGPDAKPREMLSEMVDRWRQAADEAGLAAGAKRLGYTPHEVMTIASLIEAEASRDQDRAKVARVIYNRIENPGTAGTTGKLQIDATINYAMGRDLGFGISSSDRSFDSPYNTYVANGLPPGPIEAPGDKAIEAALQPAEGDWYYYVTVDLRTGETKFAESSDEFEGYVEEFREYCQTSDAC